MSAPPFAYAALRPASCVKGRSRPRPACALPVTVILDLGGYPSPSHRSGGRLLGARAGTAPARSESLPSANWPACRKGAAALASVDAISRRLWA